jgi:hypothetical protein
MTGTCLLVTVSRQSHNRNGCRTARWVPWTTVGISSFSEAAAVLQQFSVSGRAQMVLHYGGCRNFVTRAKIHRATGGYVQPVSMQRWRDSVVINV